MICDHAEKPVPLFRRSGGLKPTGHVETVPADDAVLDKPVAAFGSLLFDLVGMFETTRVSDSDGPGETVRELRLIELCRTNRVLSRLPARENSRTQAAAQLKCTRFRSNSRASRV